MTVVKSKVSPLDPGYKEDGFEFKADFYGSDVLELSIELDP